MADVIAALMVAAIVLALPVLSFLRTRRLQSEVTALRARVASLERRLGSSPEQARAAAPEAPVAAGGLPAAAREFLRAAAPEQGAAERPLELEQRIGGRWLQHAGMAVLVLGIAFFLRYAFENEWLSPAIRVALGAVTGTGMAVGGLRLSRRYHRYGLFLTGGGVAVLYLSVYAGLNLYALIGAQLAFVLLLVVTAVAAGLADRTGSLALAVMAVCGGFATPFLVGGQRDQHLVLFTYVGLLVAATMYLAHRRRWPWLNVVGLGLTILTVLAWAVDHYTADKYLRAELFMTLYCAMFCDILRKAWPRARHDGGFAYVLLVAPAAYHAWSVFTLAPHPRAFLIYTVAVTLVAVTAAVYRGSSVLRLAAWIAVAIPLGVWIETHQWLGWQVATTVAILGIYAVHLAASLRAARAGEELDLSDVTLVHANGIGVFAALHQVLADSSSDTQLALVAAFFAAGNAGLWAMLRAAAAVNALHWLGVSLTLTAIAIWIQAGGPWAVAAWATEGAIAFWIATRSQRSWLRAGGWALLALATYRWLQDDIQVTTATHVVLANGRALTGLYLVAVFYAAAWFGGRPDTVHAAARRLEQAALIVSASVVTLIVLSTEIMSFWAVRTASPDAAVAREMMLSAAWVMYAAVLVAAGMRYRYPPVRYFAIVLFGVTLAKVFLIDLATLAGIYRVAGFIVVGLILLIVSFLYQRANAAAASTPSGS